MASMTLNLLLSSQPQNIATFHWPVLVYHPTVGRRPCCCGSPIFVRGWFHFLPRDALLSAVYAVVVCLCVCVSVTLRYCIKTAKRRITQTTPHDSPMTLSFLTPKIVAKFERDHPLRGRRMQVGWVKIGHFRRKTRYNSIMVQDRRIVSIKVE